MQSAKINHHVQAKLIIAASAAVLPLFIAFFINSIFWCYAIAFIIIIAACFFIYIFDLPLIIAATLSIRKKRTHIHKNHSSTVTGIRHLSHKE